MDFILILILVAVFAIPVQSMTLHSVLVLAMVAVICVGLIVWFRVALPRWNARVPVELRTVCYCCGYDLSAFESVLGDDIWVGPEICPECGERYPAIG